MTEENHVLIVGIVKDVASTIAKDMERLNAAFSRFQRISWFLVESNSGDRTRETLSRIKQKNPEFDFVTIDSVAQNDKFRTVALAEARNRYLAEVIQNPKFKSLDFVVVSDFNNLNNRLTKLAVDSCFTGEVEWDVCCANQEGPYYDIWALRHPLWSPNDCWEAHAFFREHTLFPETALVKAVNSRMIKIKRTSNWIEVDSAFGGIAIYRRGIFVQGEYVGVNANLHPICEHVPFHISIRSHGAKIFINPEFVNLRKTDHSSRSRFDYKMLRILKYPVKLLRYKNNF